jgi:hypothetical protein
VTDDLGLQILWEVDPSGVYTAKWEVPLSARLTTTYRFVVHGKKYTLASKPFKLKPAADLEARLVSKSPGRAVVQLAYPTPVVNVDLTYRPAAAAGGVAAFRVNDKLVRVKVARGGRFVIHGRPGDEVHLPAGAGRDRFGNRTSNAFGVSL